MARKKGIKVNGLILLDKPIGLTSNGVLQRVRKLFGAQKAGHTGSLDPLATGVLPICFGEATKFSSYGLEADKAYIATGVLGQATETGDCEGAVVSELPIPEGLDEHSLCEVLTQFTGTVHQVPSMYSALKYQGKPLYEYARKGIEIPREGRNIEIFELRLIKLRPNSFEVYVRCSKGTYIRTLVEDIGKKLGCGAHVSVLRRVQSGPFGIDDCITFENLEAKVSQLGVGNTGVLLRPVDSLIDHLPEISLGNADASSILQGQTVRMPSSPRVGVYRLYADTGKFLGIADINDAGEIAPKRLISSTSDQ